MARTVAVIGAGASGLPSIKSCLDEGLEPVCFERSEALGGLWRFTEDVRDGQGCVTRSTVIDTSKEIMAYSDFPIPAEFPNFLHNTKVWQYFEMYAEHFGLKKYIRFQTEVLKLVPDEETGRWAVTTRKGGSQGNEEAVTTEFDAVMLCIGHHATAKIPQLPGMDTFTGKIVHTSRFKDSNPFTGQRVAIVGSGNSGIDAAVDLSRVTSQTFLSTRRGAWIRTKLDVHGYPNDLNITRYNALKERWFPKTFDRQALKALNDRFDHKLYGLQPAHGFRSVHPTVQDELPSRILAGAVKVKPDVKSIGPNSIEFMDNSVEKIDTIVLATGYMFSFPFLDKSLVDVQNNEADLYLHAFPVTLKKPTLAAIGYFQPTGAIMPISELQARWAVRVFKGLVHLPDKASMLADIKRRRAEVNARYVAATRHTMQVDHAPFMDDVAKQIGVKPKLGRRLLTDPRLWWRMVFGPFAAYQFRLDGPGSWPGARQAIMTIYDRVKKPLESGRVMQQASRRGRGSAALAGLTLVGAVLLGTKVYQDGQAKEKK